MDKSDLSLSLSLKLKNSKFMQTIPTNYQFKETPLNNVHYKRYTMLVTANLIYYYLFFPFYLYQQERCFIFWSFKTSSIKETFLVIKSVKFIILYSMNWIKESPIDDLLGLIHRNRHLSCCISHRKGFTPCLRKRSI